MTRVTAQQDNLRGHAGRWAYVLSDDDGSLYVSAYRYSSKASALAAGHADVAQEQQWHETMRKRTP
jgi:hypothetical protein